MPINSLLFVEIGFDNDVCGDFDNIYRVKKFHISDQKRYMHWVVKVICKHQLVAMGALITHTAVVTAASCFAQRDINKCYVMLADIYGTNQTEDNSEIIGFQSGIEKIETVEKIKVSMKENVARLQLSTPIGYSNSSVSLICLPNTTWNGESAVCVLATWQTINDVSLKFEQYDFRFLEDDQCKSASHLELLKRFGRYNKKLYSCGYSEMNEKCLVANGSPIFCSKQNKWYLHSIALDYTDYGCSFKQGPPQLYTQIAGYANWIQTGDLSQIATTVSTKLESINTKLEFFETTTAGESTTDTSSTLTTQQQTMPVWSVNLSSKIVSRFKYRNRDITIWDDKDSEMLPVISRQFYVMPTAELVPSSAICAHRKLTDTYKVSFEIQTWSTRLETATVDNLKIQQLLNVDKNQIHPLPFYQLRLIWKDSDTPKDFYIDDTWIDNYLQQYYVHTFDISAANKAVCDTLVEVISKRTHELTNSVSLEYTLSPNSVKTKLITVKADHVTSCLLYGKLANMDTDLNVIRYLRASDLHNFVTKSIKNVLNSELTSNDFVNNADQASLKDLIMKTFKVEPLDSRNFTSLDWKAVYWNPDYARPDKIASYLNKELKIEKGGKRIFMRNNNNSTDARLVTIGRATIRNNESTTSSGYNLEDIQDWLKVNDFLVEIKSDMFTAKDTELFRLDLHNLQLKEVLATKLVQIRHVDSTGLLKVTIANAE